MQNDQQTKVLRERTVPGLHAGLYSVFAQHVAKELSILDLGCGSGAWAERLRSEGYNRVWCVDADAAQYLGSSPFCQVDLNSDFSTRVSSELAMPVFDVITAVEVVEHLENTSALLRVCRQLLTPNGLLILTTPNVSCAPGRLRFLYYGQLRHFDEHGDPTHINPIFPRLLTALAESNGFKLQGILPLPNSHTFHGTSMLNATLARLIGSVVTGETTGDCTLFILKRHKVSEITPEIAPNSQAKHEPIDARLMSGRPSITPCV